MKKSNDNFLYLLNIELDYLTNKKWKNTLSY